MSHFCDRLANRSHTDGVQMMTTGFQGKHSASGTIVNALAAGGFVDPKTGKAYTEALAFGAGGGIAFGNFVFEYTGQLPHVSLLTRNTFGPFERGMDNMAIRRESRETTDPQRAEKNLRLELDAGNPVIVLADVYSLPYKGLCGDQMWYMAPLAVVGQDGSDFLIVDGRSDVVRLSAEALAAARGRVKKDRYRMIVLEAPDQARLADGLVAGIRTCAALFLDKPPAGSPNNFGLVGMRHWAKMLIDPKNPKSWTKVFEPGPRLSQALAGRFGQPGVWDWIEEWGTARGADRGVYADFLIEAEAWTGLSGIAKAGETFRQTAELWTRLADQSMPDSIPEMKELKSLKRRHSQLWVEKGLDGLDERSSVRAQMREATDRLAESATLRDAAPDIQASMSETVSKIADLEEEAVQRLRDLVGT